MTTLNANIIHTQFGWSHQMVCDLLGDSNAYTIKDVYNARKSPLYTEYIKQNFNNSVRNSYEETIFNALYEPIQLTKDIPHLHLLHNEVINAKLDLFPEIFVNNGNDVPTEVLHRWYVNRLRHKYTEYDNILKKYTRVIGSNIATKIIKYRVYKLLLRTYNGLLDEEIHTQIHNRTAPICNQLNTFKDIRKAFTVISNKQYFYNT